MAPNVQPAVRTRYEFFIFVQVHPRSISVNCFVTKPFRTKRSHAAMDADVRSRPAARKEQNGTLRGTELSYSIREINFRRLLQKCEDMARSGDVDGWRFEKYIEALDQLFSVLKFPEKPDELPLNGLSTYEQRIQILKKALRPDAHQSETEKRRSLFHQHGTSGHGRLDDDIVSPVNDVHEASGNRTRLFTDLASVEERPASKALPVADFVPRTTDDANRKELLESPGRINKDMDVVVSAEIGRQEKITEEMLHLTRSLKENMSTANQLVKRDFKVRNEDDCVGS
ncbi:hypothetical protein RvY_09308 [Ramazzottius varieornatus]|uniref:Vesicle transport protein USE1 n=1 Tax=Ramazzottius varieornatus TaxID=947166 RepID=A0A1D1VBD3_RAMVA|nr:hypothetical protein RvY_09308 [Ramazzottius varieornatus]